MWLLAPGPCNLAVFCFLATAILGSCSHFLSEEVWSDSESPHLRAPASVLANETLQAVSSPLSAFQEATGPISCGGWDGVE